MNETINQSLHDRYADSQCPDFFYKKKRNQRQVVTFLITLYITQYLLICDEYFLLFKIKENVCGIKMAAPMLKTFARVIRKYRNFDHFVRYLGCC